MIDAKMPDNLPQWMKDHVDRYLKSGGKDGHMFTTPTQPGLLVQIMSFGPDGRMPMMTLHAGGGGVNVGAGG